jgi:HAD superfamily hydrolase (TIGR01509 family)
MIQALLFDFEGVLCTPVYQKIIDAHFPPEQRAAWAPKLEQLNLGAVTEEDFITQISTVAQVPRETIVAEVQKAPVLNAELMQYIFKLRNQCSVGIISNVPRSLVKRVLGTQLQLLFTASVVATSSDLRLLKPDPAVFSAALARARCFPREILFVDDEQKNVDVANNLGMHGLVYTNVSTIDAIIQKAFDE